MSQFLREEVASKVGVADEFYIGLPDPKELDRDRVANVNAWSPLDLLMRSKYPPEFVRNFVLKPWSYAFRSIKNPQCCGDPPAYNTEELRTLEVPAANGHASARAVAAMY